MTSHDAAKSARDEGRAAARPPLRLDSLQLGRFLAALIVVMFHANLTVALPKYFAVEPFPLARGGYAGVEFFFVLSGFVIGLNHSGDMIHGTNAASFAWKRFRRIYPALWIVLSGLLAITILAPGLASGSPASPLDILGSFALFPYLYPSLNEPILVVIWSLRFEILFYGLVLVTIFHRGLGIALAGALLVAALASLFLDHRDNTILLSPYPLLFAMGVAAAFLFRLHRPIPQGLLLLAGAGVFAAGWRIAATAAGGYTDNALVLLFGLGSCLIVIGATHLERVRTLAIPRWAVVLGDASYAIYLVHYPVIAATAKLSTRFAGTLGVDAFAAYAACVVASVLAGLAFHLTVEKALLRMIPSRLGRARAAHVGRAMPPG